jgi:hypothetical protein
MTCGAFAGMMRHLAGTWDPPMNPEQLSLPLTLLFFVGGALVIAWVGSRLTRM